MGNTLIEVFFDEKYGKIAHFIDYKNKHIFCHVIESKLGIIYKEVTLNEEKDIIRKLGFDDELYNVEVDDESSTR